MVLCYSMNAGSVVVEYHEAVRMPESYLMQKNLF